MPGITDERGTPTDKLKAPFRSVSALKLRVRRNRMSDRARNIPSTEARLLFHEPIEGRPQAGRFPAKLSDSN